MRGRRDACGSTACGRTIGAGFDIALLDVAELASDLRNAAGSGVPAAFRGGGFRPLQSVYTRVHTGKP